MGKKRGNGEGTIVKVKDGLWRGAIVTGRDSKGNLKRKWFSGKTKKEVIDKIQPFVLLYGHHEDLKPVKII